MEIRFMYFKKRKTVNLNSEIKQGLVVHQEGNMKSTFIGMFTTSVSSQLRNLATSALVFID